MKPYYQEDGITIYHGDCREILPSQKADLLLTDPPYGIGRDGSKKSTGSHGGRKAYEFLGWDSQRPSAETFRMMFNATKEQIIWGGNYFSEYLPPTMGWMVWDKGQRIDQSDGELAFTSFDKALRIYTLNRASLMGDGVAHPTQKPLELMKWCILQCSEMPMTILDPFMGSGTTLRAAKDLNRLAVGVEWEEKYCEIAAKRLSQRVLEFS